ncbi:MAG: trypsin-like peptidase domain-containing protein [Candidatus Eisenbacteria bacterium]
MRDTGPKPPESRRAGRSAVVAGLLAALLVLAIPAALHAQTPDSGPPADFAAVAQRVRPAVVTILARNNETRRGGRPGESSTRVHTRVGSGVAVEESSVLTTASVVLKADRVMVRTANGLQVEAQIVGVDPVFNLALLRVPGLRLPALPFATDRSGQIGDWVLTVGSSYRFQLTESAGTVSASYREPRLSLLQLTNTVSPGNSGGAAVNARGELIGIVQGELGIPELGATPDRERRPSTMSFVLPADAVKRVYLALRRDGRVRHGYLGVTTSGASVASETEQGLDVPIGALVENVIAGGPAAKLGLRKGDLIVGFEGERVEYPGQLARWVAATPPATAVGLVWVRGDLQREGSAELADSPDAAPAWAVRAAPEAGAGRAPATAPGRIADIERQIRQLNRQLGQIKGESTSTRRE